MPTSGEPPYTLSADINGAEFIDNVYYRASVRSSGATGNCPTRGTAAPLSPTSLNALIKTGTTTSTLDVPLGDCRTYTLEIFDVSDNSLVAEASTSVDNV